MLTYSGQKQQQPSSQERIRYIRQSGVKWKAKTSTCSLYLSLFCMQKVRKVRRKEQASFPWVQPRPAFSV